MYCRCRTYTFFEGAAAAAAGLAAAWGRASLLPRWFNVSRVYSSAVYAGLGRPIVIVHGGGEKLALMLWARVSFWYLGGFASEWWLFQGRGCQCLDSFFFAVSLFCLLMYDVCCWWKFVIRYSLPWSGVSILRSFFRWILVWDKLGVQMNLSKRVFYAIYALDVSIILQIWTVLCFDLYRYCKFHTMLQN